MNKEKARQKYNNVQSGWGGILQDAESALREAQIHTRKLKRSIRVLREKVKANEPMPDYLECKSTQN